MSIVGVLRDDWDHKPGGDVSLIRYYLELMSPAAVRMQDATSAVRELRGGHAPNAALIANLDRYFEFNNIARQFRDYFVPTLLAPIHHPVEGIAKYNRAAELGKQRPATRTIRSPLKIELLRHVLRTRRFPNPLQLTDRPVRQSLGSVLQSGTVIVQAPSEAVELGHFLGIPTPASHFVPNPIHFLDSPITPLRDIDVLIVGRIEPRKNQLRVAEYLAKTRLNAIFVGGINAKHSSYARRFLTVVATSKHIRHSDHASLAELSDLYKRTKVMVGISFMEVVSLAHLDAVGHGAQLLTTMHSYTGDYLGDNLHALDPLVSESEFLEAIELLLHRGVNEDGWMHLKSTFPLSRARDEMATALAQLSGPR